MKKTLFFVIAMLFAFIVKAQQIKGFYSFDKQQNTIEFDITKISLFEQRMHFVYLLNNDERFDVSVSDKDGVFLVKRNNNSYNFNVEDAFIGFYNEETSAFNSMTKDEIGDLYSEWKSALPNNFVASMMMDVYVRDRQNNLCATADPFCTDVGVYQFPAGVNAGAGESGPNYNCLSTRPNPAWYYMKMANPGNMTIYMYSTPSVDIDFCCWGPFDDPITPCPNGLTGAKVVSCSYAPAHTENCVIPASAQTGQYYILVITNFSNQQCNITFSKTAGTGTTDCSIMPPLVENDGPYCVGETIHLSGNAQSGASYSWSGPGGWNATGQNVTRPNCTIAMAGTYTCTIALNGQTSSTDTQVEVFATPTANFNTPNAYAGVPTQFTSTSTTNPSGQTITSYLWNFGDGQTSTQQNPTHTYAAPGNYNVSLTVACGENTCTNTNSISLTVQSSMTTSITGDNTACQHTPITLTAVASGGTGSYTYAWKKNGVAIPGANASTLTQTMNEVGNYAYSCDINDGYTTQSPTHNVVVNEQPVAEAGEDQHVNYQNSATLTAGTVSGATYNWQPSSLIYGGNNTTQTVQTVPLTETATFTVTVTKNGCSDSDDVTVVVGDAMSGTASIGNNSICENETTYVKARAFGGNGTYTYSWEPAAEVQNPHADSTLVFPSLATTYFTCTISDGLNTITKRVNVSVHPLPEANAGLDQSIYFNKQADLEAGYIEGATYSWQPANKISGNPNMRTVRTKALQETTTFTVTVTNDHGCVNDDSVVVSVGAELTASATIADNEICENEWTTVTVTAHNGDPNNYSYSWEPANQVEYPNSATTRVYPEVSTDHFTCTITDGETTIEETVNIIVHALPIADAGEDQLVNYSHTATLTAAKVDEGTYEWLPANMIQGDNHQQTVTTVNLTDETEFTLIVTRYGCTAEDKVTVFAGNQLQGNVTTADNSICQFDGSAELTARAVGGNLNYTYFWESSKACDFSTNGEPTTILMNPTESGEYIISCTIFDGENTIVRSTSINVVAQPQAHISVSGVNIIDELPSVVQGRSVTLEAAAVAGATYEWQPNTLIMSTSDNGRIATTYPLNNPGMYEFELTVKTQTATSNYCTNSTSKSIKVYNDITATAESDNMAICEQETVTLTAHASGGTGSYKYTWSPAGYFSNNVGQTVTTNPLPGHVGIIKFTCQVEDTSLDNANDDNDIEITIYDGPTVNHDLQGTAHVVAGNEFYPIVYEYSIDSLSLAGHQISDIAWEIKSEYQTPNQLDSITHESLWQCIPDPNPLDPRKPMKAYVYINEEGNAKLKCTITGECGETTARIILWTNDIYYYEDDDVSVDEINYDDIITIYPNPNNGELYVSMGDIITSPVTVSIYNFSGMKMMQFTESGNVVHYSINTLANGMYFVRITGKDFVVTKKFVLNK